MALTVSTRVSALHTTEYDKMGRTVLQPSDMSSGAPARILLVEDNAADAALFRLAVAESGLECSVHVAATAEQALILLRQCAKMHPAEVPTLLLLDWNLPGTPGADLLRVIKTDTVLHRIPVIVFSSSDHRRDVERGYELYANGWVTKPIALDEYFEAVRRILSFWLRDASLPAFYAERATGVGT